jgi:hypothetical protein
MFTEDRDKWDVLVGALVVAIVIVGVFTIGSQRPPRVLPGPVATTPLAAPAAATPRVDMGHASVKRVSDPSIAVAYECTRDGQRILSDRPCGADASIRRIAEPNRMDAQDTRALYSPVYVGSQRSRGTSSTGEASSTSGVCDSIEAQIDSINARMRHAYRNREGEQLRERLRELSRQRYEAKCIR